MTTIQTALRQIIADSFSLEDLALLCTDIGIDPDTVPGRDKGKEFYLGEIINYAQRRGLLDALVEKVKELRPHLQLDFSSLDAASIAGWLYSDAHLEVDRQLFREIRDRLRKCLLFARDHNFATPFDPIQLQPMSLFVVFCQDPESEFFNLDLNQLCLLVRDEVVAFSELVSSYTRRIESPDWSVQFLRFADFDSDEFMMALHELDIPEEGMHWLLDSFKALSIPKIVEARRESSLANLRSSMNKVWNAYYAFVQEGRRQLGVA